MIRVALAALLLAAPAAAEVAEPAAYRMDEYRAPVPATLDGARVVEAAEAHALWQEGATFIDVLPRAPKPDNLPPGTIWRDQPRETIPGSFWLPNVGYGELAPQDDSYFRAGLEAATGADPGRPIVIFCLSECWMSWNAAKRALAYGYTDVHWLPEGTDGWTFEDYPTERVEPWRP